MTTRPELIGDLGMVASTHWLATATGMSVLERGGNAVDAAVAGGFVLQVVEPHLNGLGGDATILCCDQAGDVRVYCGQGTSPQAAGIDHFRSLGLTLVPGTGFLPAVVPGAFGAWLLMLERQGTWRLEDVLEYAIGYADNGFPLVPDIISTIRRVEELFRHEWPTSAETYLSQPLRAGARFQNRVLAETYRRIVRESKAASSDRDAQIRAGRDAFYRGFVAEAIERFVTREVMDSSGRRHRGLLTGQDMAEWSPSVEDSVTYQYGDLLVHKAGPWSQGPVFLQQLAILDGSGLASMDHLSVEWIHTIVETAKLAFADREAWYGDPNRVDVPVVDLLSASYAEQRRALLGDRASFDLRPGSPGGRRPVLPDLAALAGAVEDANLLGSGEPTVRSDGSQRGDTCHIDVVDRSGTMVAATPSGGWLHSSPIVPELGLSLGTRGQMFWLEPGLPTSMAGGARPRTTLTPSIATRDGKPRLAFGTPGGDQQDQWSLSFLMAYLHTGMSLQAAIDAPMFHTTHFPSSFYPRQAQPGHIVVEDRVGTEVIDGLRARGHEVDVAGGWSQGRLSAVAIDPETGFVKAAANPRGAQGYAAGR